MTPAMLNFDTHTLGNSMRRQSSPGFYGTGSPQDIAVIQSRFRYHSLGDLMWCQGMWALTSCSLHTLIVIDL
jgi:hypothetical protein